MCFWKEKKISMFSASQHKMFLRLRACVKKDLLKDCKLGWTFLCTNFVKVFFCANELEVSVFRGVIVKCLILLTPTEAATDLQHINTYQLRHLFLPPPSLVAFCPLPVCHYHLCMSNSSLLCCGSIFATVTSGMTKIYFYAGWIWLFAAMQMWLHLMM